MTVYRRPDPIPLRSATATPRTGGLTQIRPEQDNLNRLVAREIFLAIVGGRFPVGSILPNEHQLAASLGVSRTALREAIKGLASKGLLETRRKRGTQVLEREHWNLLDPELISWSRRESGARTSRELWEAAIAVQPAMAAGLARTGHSAAIAEAVRRFEAAIGAAQRRVTFCQLLFDIAAHANPYLRALNAACLRSLLKDDPDFLDEQIANVGSAALRALVDAIRDRNPDRASLAAHQILASGNAAPADLLQSAG